MEVDGEDTSSANFYGGSYADGKWYCACGLEVQALTSKTQQNKGKKFWRCPKSRETCCKFYYWDEELPAVLERYLRGESHGGQPSTPSKAQYREQSRYPESHSGLTDIFGAAQLRDVPRPEHEEFSVTPRKRLFQDDSVSFRGSQSSSSTKDRDLSLSEKVLELLSKNEVVVKPSVRAQLQHLIDVDVNRLKAEVDTTNALVEQLIGGLDKRARR